MTNEEIMKLLKEHEERKASDKPSPMKNMLKLMPRTSPRWMTTQSSAHTWPSARLWTKKNWMKRATSLTKWKLYAPFGFFSDLLTDGD